MPQHLRGKYRAFSPAHTRQAGAPAGAGAGAREGLTAGQAHLASLRAAGLTHVHLLPSYDYGSVPEREEEQQRVEVRARAATFDRRVCRVVEPRPKASARPRPNSRS